MARRERAAVFFFDILGFADLVDDDHDRAVDALSHLAAVLNLPGIADQTARWEQRYGLSDSVFLTHRDATVAVQAAADLMSNLVSFTMDELKPTLVRGALALGEVEHVRGLFDLGATVPANLVGSAVTEAVRLERQGRGPRIFVSATAAAAITARDAALANWLLARVEGDVSELLWPLSSGGPQTFDDAAFLDVCTHALRLFEAHAAHPESGAHYREFVLLIARSLATARQAVGAGAFTPRIRLDEALTLAEVRAACRMAESLPDRFFERLTAFLSAP